MSLIHDKKKRGQYSCGMHAVYTCTPQVARLAYVIPRGCMAPSRFVWLPRTQTAETRDGHLLVLGRHGRCVYVVHLLRKTISSLPPRS